MEVADRIVVMNAGRIEQVGAPDEVYDHPASPFVLQFLGDVNLFHGRAGGSAPGDPGPAGHATGAAAGATDALYVRPHELQIIPAAEEGSFTLTLAHALTVGPNTRLEFQRADAPGYVDVELPRAEYQSLRRELGLAPGSTVHLRPRRVTRFGGAPPAA